MLNIFIIANEILEPVQSELMVSLMLEHGIMHKENSTQFLYYTYFKNPDR